MQSGWRFKPPVYKEDVAATIYSVLGIDWTKRLRNTPIHVDPAPALGVGNVSEISVRFLNG